MVRVTRISPFHHQLSPSHLTKHLNGPLPPLKPLSHDKQKANYCTLALNGIPPIFEFLIISLNNFHSSGSSHKKVVGRRQQEDGGQAVGGRERAGGMMW